MPAIDTRTEDRTLPPPLRAGIGLVAAGVERARHLPEAMPGGIAGLASLPMRGLAFFATAREAVERTYEELSNRGETVVARWRHKPEPRQTSHAPGEPAAGRAAAGRAPAGSAAAEPTIVEAVLVEPAHVDLTEGVKPGATLSHDELPLEDYDHLTLGSLRARLAKLDLIALAQLRDYERVHANRLPVLTMLENRIAKVSA
jgi:hypothetical protein